MGMQTDGAYALTRRRGAAGTVSRLTASSANPETGAKTDTIVTTSLRWVYKEPTRYARLFRAQMAQQRIGDTTFVIWLPDVEAIFTSLRQEDYITFGGKRFEVVSSSIEDNAFVVTAREFV